MSGSITRELSVKYNGLTIGGNSSDYRLTGFLRVRQEPEVGQFEFDVIVVGATEGAFSSAVREFEDKISEPWNNLEVRQGSSEILVVKTSDATALNPVVTAQKVGSSSDTGRLRRYHCVATWGRPADYNEDSEGLRNYDVQVSYTPARVKAVTLAGVYTAVGTQRARAQYDAKKEAWSTAVLQALDSGATFELVDEQASHDVNDALLTFSRLYEQVIYDQGSSGLDNANITQQTLQITPMRIGATTYKDNEAEGLTEIELRYSAWINKEQTSDLEGEYDGLRPWLIEKLDEFFGGSTFALMEDAPIFDPVQNRIEVRMRALGAQQGEGIIAMRVDSEDSVDYGLAAVHGWTGRSTSKFIYEAEAQVVRTINLTMRKIGEHTKRDALDELDKIAGEEKLEGISGDGEQGRPEISKALEAAGGAEGKWFPMSRNAGVVQQKLGLSDRQLDYTDMRATTTRFWAENLNTGGSGGGTL